MGTEKGTENKEGKWKKRANRKIEVGETEGEEQGKGEEQKEEEGRRRGENRIGEGRTEKERGIGDMRKQKGARRNKEVGRDKKGG